MSRQPEFSSGLRLRVCPNCRYLTRADYPRCEVCGTLAPEYVEQEKAIRFVRAVFQRTTRFTYILSAVNLVMFFLTALAGGSGEPVVLEAFGAKQAALIQAGEYWRLVVPIFLHIGILHLACNSWGLWVLGRQLEALYGSARFVVIYVVTGIAAFVASYFLSPPLGVGAGASGSLFGLFGVFAAFAFRYKGEVPELLRRSIRNQILFWILVNLVLTFSIPQIDRAGHIGGLLAGVVAGWMIPYARPRERGTRTVWVVLQTLSLGLVLACFGALAWHYDGPRLSFANLSLQSNLGFGFGDEEAPAGSIAAFIDAINDGEKTFDKLHAAPPPTDPKQVAERLADNARAREKLARVPWIGTPADVLRKELFGLLDGQAAALGAGAPDPTLDQKREAYQKSLQRWADRYGYVVVDERQAPPAK